MNDIKELINSIIIGYIKTKIETNIKTEMKLERTEKGGFLVGTGGCHRSLNTAIPFDNVEELVETVRHCYSYIGANMPSAEVFNNVGYYLLNSGYNKGYLTVDEDFNFVVGLSSYYSFPSSAVVLSNYRVKQRLETRSNSDYAFMCMTKDEAENFCKFLKEQGEYSFFHPNGEVFWEGQPTVYGTDGYMQKADMPSYRCVVRASWIMLDSEYNIDRFDYLKLESVPAEDLVHNNYYVLRGHCIDERIFRYKSDTSSPYCYKGKKSIYHFSVRDFGASTIVFNKATEEEISFFKSALAEQRRIDRERYLAERFEYFNNRDITLKARKELQRLSYNEDVKTQLFSVSFKNIIAIAPENRLTKTLLKLNKLGYFKDSIRNITIRKSDKAMTYTPAGKETELTSQGVWSTKGRQDSKYGKLIRKVLVQQVPKFKIVDSEIEQLVNFIKAQTDDGSFSIVSGEDIRHWYHTNQYDWDNSDKIGTLQHSCMRDQVQQKYLDIYCCNSQVELIILVKNGKLRGRALLWTAEDGKKFMDRIYGTDSTFSAFKQFAREKGYHFKSNQNSSNDELWVTPEGDNVEIEVEILLDCTAFKHYPYADTFTAVNVDGVNNYNEGDEMQNTNGGLNGDENENEVYDEYDDTYIDVEDSVYVQSHGYRTHTDNVFLCDYDSCHYLLDDRVETYQGHTVYSENAVWVDTASSWSDPDECYTCTITGNLYIEDDEPSVINEDGDQVAQCNYTEQES